MTKLSDRPEDESCTDCRFFMINPKVEGLGWCRRFPPVVQLLAVEEHPGEPPKIIGGPPTPPHLVPKTQAFFSQTAGVNWCGEFKMARRKMQ